VLLVGAVREEDSNTLVWHPRRIQFRNEGSNIVPRARHSRLARYQDRCGSLSLADLTQPS
jgi:hypothetical protein